MKKRTLLALLSTLGLLSAPLAFAEGNMKDKQQEEVQQQEEAVETPQQMEEGEAPKQHEQTSYNTLDQLSEDQVSQIQQELNKKGFDAGNVDGMVGQETRNAIERFQQSEGIAATGDVNQETLDKLDVDIKLQAQEEGEEQKQEEGEVQQQEESEGLFQ